MTAQHFADIIWYEDSAWWLVLLTSVLAVATVSLAIYTARLFRATLHLGVEAKATAARQAAETAKSLEISGNLASSAAEQLRLLERQIQLSEQQLRRAHRPWLVLSDTKVQVSMHFDDRPAFLNGSLIAKNFGRGLAFRVTQSSHLYIGPDRDPLSLSGEPIPAELLEQMPFGALVKPDDEYVLQVHAHPKVFDVGQTSEVALYLFHRIYYSDEFGDRHTSGVLLQGITLDGHRTMKPRGTVELTFRTVGVGTSAT